MRYVIYLDGIWAYFADTKNEFKDLDGTAFESRLGDLVATRPWKKCIVPSVTNLQDRSLFRFFGKAFYKVSFKTPAGASDHLVGLKLGGVNYKATVWLNGKYLGEHENGYTGFSFDVGAFLHHDSSGSEDNELVVLVDNSWGHKDWLPWTRKVDWFNYNGIHRGVKLVVKPLVRISDYAIRSPMEFPAGNASRPSKLSLLARVAMENRSLERFPGAVQVEISEMATGRKVASAIEMVTVVEQGKANQDFELTLDPSAISLWSPDSPTLYRVTFRLVDGGGNKVDERSWKWGFKKFETRGEHFYLNNKRFTMRGTNRHEDHPDFGLAIPDALRYQDIVKMKDANINCFRGSHHPMGEALLDYCDELGLLFVEELPAYQLDAGMMADPGILATAKRCFDEMYDRDKNHVCLAAWSVSNECHTETKEGLAFHEALYKHARAVDDGERLVVHVSNHGVMDLCHPLSDFVTLNTYRGWYGGTMEDFMSEVDLLHEILLDEDHELGPPRPIVLTEFGAGALRGYRSWQHSKWSEDYQAEFLGHYIGECMKHDYIGGTWTWMFSDTRVDLPDRPDGRPRSYNNKGMVDEYRVPKLAYDVVKALYGKWAQREA
ncbi:MAG: beta galactosidase jelly roll domain-containing protein [Candidatus Lokiarchaeota archaeon]|nr:beta galactosidase jelly roll domain-containing protein [Candidatus Lokiarchaeota archaeon]